MSRRDSSDKKPSPVGCILLAAIAIVSFIFLPWQVALGVSINAFWIPILIYSINKEIQQIIQRNRTQKSTIAASTEGFTEVVVKLKNQPKDLQSWFTNEPAAVKWLTVYRQSYNESNSETTEQIVYYERSEAKKLRVSDGSDDAWLLLHEADVDFKHKKKRYRTEKIRKLLRDHPIEKFPMHLLDENERLIIEEHWITADAPLYVYGDHRKVSVGARPRDLVKIHEDQVQRADHGLAKLTDTDWKEMEDIASESVKSQYRIISTTYHSSDRRDVKPLIITPKGDAYVNLRSIGSIAGLLVGMIFLAGISLFLLNLHYPEYMPPYEFLDDFSL